MNSPKIQRALISVSDKLGLEDFAKGLVKLGVVLYSTGGTARHLARAGLEARDISAYTGFPEMLAGRLKTLHPLVHGGILCRRDRDDDMERLALHGIVPFELVVVNLYPFETTVAREGVSVAEAVEQIDIGGPTLIRAAAKNHTFVTIATEISQYADIIQQVSNHGCTTQNFRENLAKTAFAKTAKYDQAIADYFSRKDPSEPFPERITLHLQRKNILRYGENPHQEAASYLLPNQPDVSVATARQLHGKSLSYNNLLDLENALAVVLSLPYAATAVIKHNNPCGAAVAGSLDEATRMAFASDPVSAFGSVLAVNQTLNVRTAEQLTEPDRFVEAIIAPDFDSDAVKILTTKPKWKNSVRLLKVGPLIRSSEATIAWQHVQGGFLLQQADTNEDAETEWKIVSARQPTETQMADLRFAWSVCRHVRSNAIVLAKNQAVVGVGAGQMSRVDAVEIALNKSGSRSSQAVLASDGFFPFDDSIRRATDAGVTAFIQPGGSRRDKEVISTCDIFGVVMICTGRRHFRH